MRRLDRFAVVFAVFALSSVSKAETVSESFYCKPEAGEKPRALIAPIQCGQVTKPNSEGVTLTLCSQRSLCAFVGAETAAGLRKQEAQIMEKKNATALGDFIGHMEKVTRALQLSELDWLSAEVHCEGAVDPKSIGLNSGTVACPTADKCKSASINVILPETITVTGGFKGLGTEIVPNKEKGSGVGSAQP